MTDRASYIVAGGDPDLADIPEITMFGDARHPSAQPRLGPHRNPGIEICLSRSGVYRWNVEGNHVEIRPGELSVTMPWQEHSGQDNILGPGRLCWVILAAGGNSRLDAPLLHELLGVEADALFESFSGDRPYLGELPEASGIFDRIRDELTQPRAGRRAAILAECTRLLVLVARRLREPGLAEQSPELVPDAVMEVLRLVTDDPAAEWTSQAMAAQAGMGLTAFTEWCKRATGRSPRWYVLAVRLDLARTLLATTATPITEIALDAGFSSSQHFASAFRKLYGESPSGYRERAGEAGAATLR